MKKLLLILLCVPLIGLGQETGCISGDCENGYGTYIWASGAKYVGEFKDGKAHGFGNYTHGEGEWKGDKYVGKWKDNEKNGEGTYTFDNGNKYAGEWKDDMYHGKGTWTYNNGDKFVGEHKDGTKHGYGTYTFASGMRYTGKFNYGKRHGKVIYTYVNGNYDKVLFDNDEVVSVKCFDNHGNEIDCE